MARIGTKTLLNRYKQYTWSSNRLFGYLLIAPTTHKCNLQPNVFIINAPLSSVIVEPHAICYNDGKWQMIYGTDTIQMYSGDDTCRLVLQLSDNWYTIRGRCRNVTVLTSRRDVCPYEFLAQVIHNPHC